MRSSSSLESGLCAGAAFGGVPGSGVSVPPSLSITMPAFSKTLSSTRIGTLARISYRSSVASSPSFSRNFWASSCEGNQFSSPSAPVTE